MKSIFYFLSLLFSIFVGLHLMKDETSRDRATASAASVLHHSFSLAKTLIVGGVDEVGEATNAGD